MQDKAEANRVSEFSKLGTNFDYPMCDLMPLH